VKGRSAIAPGRNVVLAYLCIDRRSRGRESLIAVANGDARGQEWRVGIEDVRRYYDTNTASFLRFGQSGSVGAIHGAVWGPGVRDRAGAFHYVEDLMLEHLRQLASSDAESAVLDLGCGVGASLVYLAQRASMRGVGVTLSPVQVEHAKAIIGAAKLDDRVRCIEADFTHLPQDIGSFDLAYGIESFALAPDAKRFFAEAGRVVRPGGRLVVCDTYLGHGVQESNLGPTERRWLVEFRRGWVSESLITLQQADAYASEAGFELLSDTDLTQYLELWRPRDRLIWIVVGIGRHLPLSHPRWLNLLGGNALQRALERRVIEYRIGAWTRRG